jgi:signal transduction histidine kinase
VGQGKTRDELLDEIKELRNRIAELEEVGSKRVRRAVELEALQRVSLTLTSSLELETVLDAVLGGTLDLLEEIRAVHIFVYEDERISVGATRWADDRQGIYAEPRPQGLTYTVARQGEMILVPNLRKHPLYTDAPPEWEGAIVGLPLKIGDRVVGVMNVGYAQPRTFRDAELRVMRLLGDQAAIAIENARLYDQIRSHAEELEQRVAERTEELNAYTGMIVHDLKAPLHLIGGYANLLEVELAPTRYDELDEILAASQKMVEMIDQLLLLAQVRDTTSAVERLDVLPHVEAALARYKFRLRARQIAIHVSPNLPPVLGHGPWIEEVFANLVSNAIKYMGEDTPAPGIDIRGSRQGDLVRFEVQDTGIGIAPEDQKILFDMFARLHTINAPGHGLGLSIVHRVVTKLGGEVGVESVPDKGSTFWFTLPAAEPRSV